MEKKSEVHYGMLLSHVEEQNYAICIKMDRQKMMM
jgi:hypothetical protein